MLRDGRLRLLIVDDHELVRDGICARLEDAPDMEVVGQGVDGLQAVELARDLQPDVVMLDINMPRMNGLDAAAEMRRLRLPCAILILSLYDNREYVTRARAIGADGYVLKDVSQGDMIEAIGRVARNRRDGNGEFFSSVGQVLGDQEQESRPAGTSVALSEDPYRLTEREREVLAAIARGQLNKQIAADLDISVRTVESHRSAIRQKTGGGNAARLARIAAELGL